MALVLLCSSHGECSRSGQCYLVIPGMWIGKGGLLWRNWIREQILYINPVWHTGQMIPFHIVSATHGLLQGESLRYLQLSSEIASYIKDKPSLEDGARPPPTPISMSLS